MSFSIAGKTAIVTGSANGLGLAIARHFLEQGANVMFADRDEAGLAEAVTQGNPAARAFAGDLREKLTISNLISATIDAFDRIDILVNASRQITRSDPMSIGEDGVEEMLEQNLLTSLRVSQMVARRMASLAPAEGGAGAIVNLSSIVAQRTEGELMGYSIACAALEQMTRSLAVALAPARVRVNALSIGSVLSANLSAALKADPALEGRLIAGTPLGRIAASTEMVEAVQFLASPAASFVTGQVLTVDGGRSLLDGVTSAAK